MQFLVICGPIIRFLLNKYLSQLSPQSQGSDIVRKMNNYEILLPLDIKNFLAVLQDLYQFLIQNNLNYRVSALRKYIGSGPKYKGIINLLLEMGEEVYIYPHEHKRINNLYDPYQKLFGKNPTSVQIIAPLNSDENDEIYSFFIIYNGEFDPGSG